MLGQREAEFSVNGDLVFTQNTDGTVRIWQATGSGLLLADIGGSTLQIDSSALSPDGKVLLIANGNKVLIFPCELCGPIDELIRVGQARTTRQLSDEERRKYLN
jgi:WD40 repeat protein